MRRFSLAILVVSSLLASTQIQAKTPIAKASDQLDCQNAMTQMAMNICSYQGLFGDR